MNYYFICFYILTYSMHFALLQVSLEPLFDQISKEINIKSCSDKVGYSFFSLSSVAWHNTSFPSGVLQHRLCCALQLARKFPHSGHNLLLLATLLRHEPKSDLLQQKLLDAAAQKLTANYPYASGWEGVLDWQFLGPFIVGTSELDGNPIEAAAMIELLSEDENNDIQGVYRMAERSSQLHDFPLISELVDGNVNWHPVKPSRPHGPIHLTPNVDWLSIVQALGSTSATEWQGSLMGFFYVWPTKNGNDPPRLELSCEGVAAFEIDGRLVAGDHYHRGLFWWPLDTNREGNFGIHTVAVNVRGKQSAVVNCRIRSALEKSFEALDPPFLPDVWRNRLIIGGSFVPLPIRNAHTDQLICRVKSNSAQIDVVSVGQTLWEIASGQLRTLSVQMLAKHDGNLNCLDASLEVPIEIVCGYGNDIATQKRRISLRCRGEDQSFVFSFLASDGSVQRAAAISPLPHHGKMEKSKSICPTILTFHGTSISPQDQADSYKYMPEGSTVYKFGVEGAWTLAPSRHGAHNWEGPGAQTALDALNHLQNITKIMSNDIACSASSNHVIFAGHSMGGHGALLMAAHYPDLAIALITLSAWIRKEDYGDSNAFFRHDVSNSHLSSEIKAIIEMSLAENFADLHLVNLQAVPILSRIGADDRTVHPYFLRRVVRMLGEFGHKLVLANDGISLSQLSDDVITSYTELKNKKHWWWDTEKVNDGGVVNDATLRHFMAGRIAIASQHKSDIPSTIYEHRSGVKWQAVCVNPANCGSVRGIRIERQIAPFRLSRIFAHFNSCGLHLTTENVLQIAIDKLKMFGGTESSVNLWVNGEKKMIDWTTKSMVEVWIGQVRPSCLQTENNVTSLRTFNQLGPAWRVATRPFVIVFGPDDEDNNNTRYRGEMRQMAVFLANQYYLTADVSPLVISEAKWLNFSVHFRKSFNVILLAKPSRSSLSQKLVAFIPVKLEQLNGFVLGTCKCLFCGLLSLAPLDIHEDGLALLLLAESYMQLRRLISIAIPTIPPMVRQPFTNHVPDFLLIRGEAAYSTGSRGPAGYFCAGFWGHQWEMRSDSQSCVC